jgi:hypothetical protein
MVKGCAVNSNQDSIHFNRHLSRRSWRSRKAPRTPDFNRNWSRRNGMKTEERKAGPSLSTEGNEGNKEFSPRMDTNGHELISVCGRAVLPRGQMPLVFAISAFFLSTEVPQCGTQADAVKYFAPAALFSAFIHSRLHWVTTRQVGATSAANKISVICAICGL